MIQNDTIHWRTAAALGMSAVGLVLVGCSHSDEAANSASTPPPPSKNGMKAGAVTAGQVPGSELKVGSKVKDQ